MNQKKGKLIFIGTSGWAYGDWKTFYPVEIVNAERLTFYAQNFCCVEVNSTFYHFPRVKTIENLIEQTPKKFIFALKASKKITHVHRLKNCEDLLKSFLERIEHFNEKKGPILFQLPPSFKKDNETFDHFKSFIACLPRNEKFTVEFRHVSWYMQEVYQFLKKYNIALCMSDLNGKISPIEITADFTYIRLHGPMKAYRDSYSSSQLKKWSERIQEWKASGISVYCFFDNTIGGHAVHNALELQSLCY